jgi:hypothetical protein
VAEVMKEMIVLFCMHRVSQSLHVLNATVVRKAPDPMLGTCAFCSVLGQLTLDEGRAIFNHERYSKYDKK